MLMEKMLIQHFNVQHSCDINVVLIVASYVLKESSVDNLAPVDLHAGFLAFVQNSYH